MLFQPDEAATFRTVAELRSLVTHYLARDDERHEIAARARDRALSEHTYEHRMRRVMRDTLAPELLAAAGSAKAHSESLADVLDQREKASATLDPEEALVRVVREIEMAWASR